MEAERQMVSFHIGRAKLEEVLGDLFMGQNGKRLVVVRSM